MSDIELLEELSELRERIADLELEVKRNTEDTFLMAKATMQIRQEDAERLSAYQRQNTELVEFVESVADSEGPLAERACRILGFC